MHRACTLLIAFAALFCGPIPRLLAAESSDPPNIVFIITDDQGYGDMSCHGNPILKTPNLDRLHNEGVRFTDFHVSPTCSPTRSALMTGRHEFRNGVTHTILERERLTLQATTLAQVLKSAGYQTGIFGKWHLGDEAEYQPNRRGFDEVFIHGAGGIGQSYPGSCGDAPGNTYFNPAILHNGTFEKTDGYCTDLFFGQALKWIEATRGPTLAELAQAKLSDDVKSQVEGRSLVPLLKNPQADWPERTLFTHLGRWPKGDDPGLSKYSNCSVRTPRWHLVSVPNPAPNNGNCLMFPAIRGNSRTWLPNSQLCWPNWKNPTTRGGSPFSHNSSMNPPSVQTRIPSRNSIGSSSVAPNEFPHPASQRQHRWTLAWCPRQAGCLSHDRQTGRMPIPLIPHKNEGS